MKTNIPSYRKPGAFKAALAVEAIHALIDCNDTGILDSPKGERAIEAAKRAKDALRELRYFTDLDDGSGFESTISDCW